MKKPINFPGICPLLLHDLLWSRYYRRRHPDDSPLRPQTETRKASCRNRIAQKSNESDYLPLHHPAHFISYIPNILSQVCLEFKFSSGYQCDRKKIQISSFWYSEKRWPYTEWSKDGINEWSGPKRMHRQDAVVRVIDWVSSKFPSLVWYPHFAFFQPLLKTVHNMLVKVYSWKISMFFASTALKSFPRIEIAVCI